MLMETRGARSRGASRRRTRRGSTAGSASSAAAQHRGDGFVVARTLLQAGVDTAVFVIGSVPTCARRADHLDILGRLGATVVEIGDEQTGSCTFHMISQCTLIVDAIFGTGLRSALGGMMETVVADVNASGIPTVSIDLPSGMSADTPHLVGDCIEASMTVTLAAPKLPLVLPPGEAHAGDVVIADIGIPPEVLENLEGRSRVADAGGGPRAGRAARAESHKGDSGAHDRRRSRGKTAPPTWRRPRLRSARPGHVATRLVPADRGAMGRSHDERCGRKTSLVWPLRCRPRVFSTM